MAISLNAGLEVPAWVATHVLGGLKLTCVL